ncbi:MAG TPA: hypothetical protein VGG76_07330 [Gemmatimonadaceae bacterium]|jgi:hypothetical protein
MTLRFFLALSASALFFAGSAEAQTTTKSKPEAARANAGAAAAPAAQAAPGVDSTGVYDTQALRYESRWGSADIERGSTGTVVGTVGWFRDFDLEKLVSASPRAVEEARTFKTENFRGSVASGIGALTFVTGLILTSNSSNNAASPILIILGAGGIAWGAQHLQIGYAALNRAFWWYNGQLKR